MDADAVHAQRVERFKDLLLAGVLALVGVGGFLFINPTGAEVYPGPGGITWRTLPFLYSGLLLGLVALYALSTVRDLLALSRHREPPARLTERAPVRRQPVADARRVATLVALVAYAASIAPFGFAITTPVLLFAMLTILGRRGPASNLAIALVGAALLWVLFVGVLKLPMEGRTFDPVTPALNDLWRATGAR
ncbi:tripartite tricarboxylate transporter TctB family protein [Acuticoccus sp.]|uniref:tripartite tricarboxylate transporter TctB family protein n=1 Tax=Acuticoccus sp. TaxID=1904378 RepID=UPI003B51F0F0